MKQPLNLTGSKIEGAKNLRKKDESKLRALLKVDKWTDEKEIESRVKQIADIAKKYNDYEYAAISAPDKMVSALEKSLSEIGFYPINMEKSNDRAAAQHLNEKQSSRQTKIIHMEEKEIEEQKQDDSFDGWMFYKKSGMLYADKNPSPDQDYGDQWIHTDKKLNIVDRKGDALSLQYFYISQKGKDVYAIKDQQDNAMSLYISGDNCVGLADVDVYVSRERNFYEDASQSGLFEEQSCKWLETKDFSEDQLASTIEMELLNQKDFHEISEEAKGLSSEMMGNPGLYFYDYDNESKTWTKLSAFVKEEDYKSWYDKTGLDISVEYAKIAEARDKLEGFAIQMDKLLQAEKENNIPLLTNQEQIKTAFIHHRNIISSLYNDLKNASTDETLDLLGIDADQIAQDCLDRCESLSKEYFDNEQGLEETGRPESKVIHIDDIDH